MNVTLDSEDVVVALGALIVAEELAVKTENFDVANIFASSFCSIEKAVKEESDVRVD